MASINAILYKYRKNKDGLFPIYLRIADTESTKYISLGISIPKNKWNDNKCRVRGTDSQAQKMNKMITSAIAKAEKEILDLKMNGDSVTASKIKKRLNNDIRVKGHNNSFFNFAYDLIEEYEKRGQIGTYKRYKSVLNKLKDYQSNGSLSFEEIDARFLRKYETHLKEFHDNSINTIYSNLKVIRTVFNKAIKEGVIDRKTDPFFNFDLKRGNPEREKLTLKEIQDIEKLTYKEDSLIWHIKNYFLFSFYCAGIRFSDLCELKWGNIIDRRLAYKMKKTGARKSMPLIDQSKQILERYSDQSRKKGSYIFPILNTQKDLTDPWILHNEISSKNALTNKYLKTIAEDAKIQKNLSFHISRHSFADYARKKGLDIYTISKALGHSNIKITEKYLKGFDQEDLDEKMNNLFKQ